MSQYNMEIKVNGEFNITGRGKVFTFKPSENGLSTRNSEFVEQLKMVRKLQ